MASLREIHQDEELLEQSKAILKEYLIPNEITSHLFYLTIDEKIHIRNIQQQKSNQEAVIYMVDRLIDKTKLVPVRERDGFQTTPVYQSLLDALRENHFCGHLYQTLMGLSDAPDTKDVYLELINYHLPILENIKTDDLLPHLISNDILSLNSTDYEQIRAVQRNQGDRDAMLQIVSVIWRKPADWFPKFVKALRQCKDENGAVDEDMLNIMEEKLMAGLKKTDYEEQPTKEEEDDDLDALVEASAAFTVMTSQSAEVELTAAPPNISLSSLRNNLAAAYTETKIYDRHCNIPIVVDEASGLDVSSTRSVLTGQSHFPSLAPQEDGRSVFSSEDNDAYSTASDRNQTAVKSTYGQGMRGSPTQCKELVLRSYQEELAKPALEGKNVIIVAPTGSGKTFVAIHVAKEHMEQGAMIGDHKIAFLVPTVALVEQQSKTFKKYLPKDYKILAISGSSSAETKVPLKDQLPDKHVVFMTPQILLDAMKDDPHTMLRLFTLLIFDECHHTTKDHPYNEIMARYVDIKLNRSNAVNLPQVIGLTASVGVGKAKNKEGVLKHILSLSANMDAEVIQTVIENLDDLVAHANKADQGIREVKGRREDPFSDKIYKIMGQIEKRLKAVPAEDYGNDNDLKKSLAPPSDRGHQRYTNWISQVRDRAIRIYKQETRRLFTSCMQRLDIFHNAIILNNDCRTTDALNYIEENWKEFDPAYYDTTERWLETLYQDIRPSLSAIKDKDYPNPKLQELKSILQSGTLTEESRTIIFVRTRAMTQALRNWMMDDVSLRGLHPDFLTGSGASASKAGLTQIQQVDILRYFKEGERKVIIATSVAEEGLDVQKCNLVIRYEYVTNEIAMVQARGRGRADGAKYILITDREANREMVNYIRESMMEDVLKVLSSKDVNTSFKKLVEDNQKKAKAERELREAEKMAKMKMKRSRQNIDCTMYCMKCDAFACLSQDIRKVEGTHHVVVSVDFKDRYKFDPMPKPKVFGGGENPFNMTGKISCNSCKLEWGVKALYRKAPVPVIKISSFILQDQAGNRTKCKKWKDCPFQINEITGDDLKAFVDAYDDGDRDAGDDELDRLLVLMK